MMTGSPRRSTPTPASATTAPGCWICAKDKPYQLEDRVEQLFHEKSITGRGAWNRLFDETMTDLRFEVDGERLTLEPTLTRLQDASEPVRREAPPRRSPPPSRKTCGPSR